ncbi:unnamed protein product [Discosporangium mesarthrocarpum]
MRSRVKARVGPTEVQAFLRLRGGLPENYRISAWKTLLHLPANYERFAELVRLGPHSVALDGLQKRFPLRDRIVFRKVAVLMSALAHWSPLLSEVEFSPAWVFPFAVVFGQDDLGAFEAAMTFILHWGSRFLMTFPQAPAPILAMIETSLQHHDRRVSAHLQGLGVGALTYGWPLLRTAFTEVLCRTDWLRFVDHLFAEADDPSLFEAAVVGFVIVSRATLLSICSREETESFFRQQQPVEVGEMLRVARVVRGGRSRASAEEGGVVGRQSSIVDTMLDFPPLARFRPLPRGGYPAFDGYPQCIVNYQAKQRERVAQAEYQVEQKRQLVVDLTQRAQDIGDRRGGLVGRGEAVGDEQGGQSPTAVGNKEVRSDAEKSRPPFSDTCTPTVPGSAPSASEIPSGM